MQNQIVRGVKTSVQTGADGKTRVLYHSTVVVEFDHKKITLNTGGHSTATTKRRMN